MVLRKQIQEMLERDYRGPQVSYGEVHVLKAILAIGKSPAAIGRTRLAQTVGLGQGEVKTLVARLKENNLITVDAQGCRFSEKGKKKFDSIAKTLPCSFQVPAEQLRLGKSAWAVLLRERAGRIRKGIEQRDSAVRAGGGGAVTVVYSRGRFMIPDGVERVRWRDCEARGPREPWTTIRREARPKEGDVVIVSGGESVALAEDAALSAALSIL